MNKENLLDSGAPTAVDQNAFLALDPKNVDTWKNNSKPFVEPNVQEELTKIGGLIPPGFGEYSGKPVFRLAWGQDEQIFIGGQMRLRFQDQRIPIQAPHTLRLRAYAVHEKIWNNLIKWVQAKEENRRGAALRADFALAAKPYRVFDYLSAHCSTLDYFDLNEKNDATSSDDLIKRAMMLPKEYKVVMDGADYNPIGKQCFYVLQWLPPNVMVSETAWLDARYNKQWSPENEQEIFMDVLGDYPKHGFYEHIALAVRIEKTDGAYEYLQPTIENTCEYIRQLVKIREEATLQEKDSFWIGKQWFEDARREIDHDAAAYRNTMDDIRRDVRPTFGDNPTSYAPVTAKPKQNRFGIIKDIIRGR